MTGVTISGTLLFFCSRVLTDALHEVTTYVIVRVAARERIFTKPCLDSGLGVQQQTARRSLELPAGLTDNAEQQCQRVPVSRVQLSDSVVHGA